MKSLRSRITLLSTIALVAVLIGAAVLIVNLVESQLRNELAEQNEATLAEIAQSIESDVDPLLISLPIGTDGTEFLIETTDGRFVNSTVVVTIDPGLEFDSVEDAIFFEQFEDRSTWDLTERLATAPSGASYVVTAFTPTTVVDRSVGQVRSVLWLVIPGLALLFAAGIWFTTGRVLQPVSAMTAKANQISADTLHERLAEPDTGDEIAELAGTLNSMLDRLDAAARRQRQFVSDASHELQSPLTVMIGEAELASSSTDPDAHRLANDEVVKHGKRLSTLLDDLLQLARSDEAPLNRVEIDLDDILIEQARRQARDVDTSAVAPVRIHGDPSSLSRLFRNLLDNATAYAETSIKVTCASSPEGAVVFVDDDGPGIPSEQRETVFERFTRLDPSRTRSTGGAGLGLAISHAITTAHGGTISVEDSPLGGTRVRVTLPG